MKFGFISMLAGFILMASNALASGWLVEKVGGDVFYAPDGRSWSALHPGIELPNASWIQTQRQGRVLLTRGEERILIRPDTLAAVATWNNGGVNTKVVQRTGAVALDVEVRTRKHVTVKTPHLAAVVKGTAFEVTVGGMESSVRVDRGAVDVSDEGGSGATRVTAGMQATVAPSRGRGVSVREAPPATADVIEEISAQMGPAEPATVRAAGSKGRLGNNGNSRGNGNGNPGGNGSGNSGGNGNGNVGGNGNGGGNGSGNENSGGSGNGNSGGNGGGAGNGNTNGSAGGNGSTGGNGNGNPDGGGNENSGGNGNSGGGSSGGNGNSGGDGSSGGNGNGNPDGAGTDNTGGSGGGDSGSGGSGNSGSGNSDDAGNGSPGSNGNGNSGGNGRSDMRTDASGAMNDYAKALLLKARM
ncbi:FecR domain-containing protein [Citreimonas salinaria]|uniref:FecR family protein n=1 Tax=Citreimonas salinaria TaxID=321339 RepID=A0A1H3HA77_9RHOB|nr:FecR domain-containing protein [Citreimonas salinaria]SDY11529.1 FecR family protein [Citreimonas salinaria]